MSLRLHPLRVAVLLLFSLTGLRSAMLAQNCRELKATYTVTESRCTATGSVKVTPSGGSGTYNYKMTGPTNVDYTSSSLITGLQPGTYSLTVRDIVTNCETILTNVAIPGTYVQPKFGLVNSDVTCNNGTDGKITVTGVTNGRTPFVYKIVAPSPSNVGASNSTGAFSGLTPGTYYVQMMDSCGSIQTRTISIQNYTWSITSAPVTKTNCQDYSTVVTLTDSKGQTNTSGTVFSAFTYGVVRKAGDTVWSTNRSFPFNIGNNRTIKIIAKDKCGQIQTLSWTNPDVPTVDADITVTSKDCNSYAIKITGQKNLTSPQYCLVDANGVAIPGQACNTTGVFSGLGYDGYYCVKIKNTCFDTTFQRCIGIPRAYPSVDADAKITNYTCSTFTATVTGQQNLINPEFCLLTPAGGSIAGRPCNGTGVFDNVPYGNYKISVRDGCMGIYRYAAVAGTKRVRSVNDKITTSNPGCSTFNAALGGASGMFAPAQYCLYDAGGNKITCNNTGVFPGLAYGTYCIKVTDACNDTTLTRCVTMDKPTPSGGSVSASAYGCAGTTISVTGQKNISNGTYCLLDKDGNQVGQCNSNGVFTNVPYGTYCIQLTDGCTNAVFKNCITTTPPAQSIGGVTINNLTCSTFKAQIKDPLNLYNPRYCLLDKNGNQVGACNSTGLFNPVTGYGNYTIRTTDSCTGKVFNTPFTATKPAVYADANPAFSKQTCTSFTATITGQTNLDGASYVLKTAAGTTVATSTNGVFNNISYGSYCIFITNACNDTTLQRCFDLAPTAIDANATASPSCTVDSTDLAIKVTAGTGPYIVNVYDSTWRLLETQSFSGSNATVKGLMSLGTALKFRVVVSGQCGKPDTITVAAKPSTLTPVYTITPQCPSSAKAEGSGNVAIAVTSNLTVTGLTITQQDFVPVTIGYSNKSGNTYTFSNLDAATYVLTFTFSGCTANWYDTITIPKYAFPSLAKSSAYQCDNSSFSVGASVSGGMAPFKYEIIASSPSTPSVVAPPQSSPIFAINNNTKYNLIRLRAVDACGNSALNDVSILPLANTIVTATSDCINQATTLSTDPLPNATYTWYKKSKTGDSTQVATGSPNYSISNVRFADTGLYVAKTMVNSGCLTKVSYFRLTGTCGVILPTTILLEGRALGGSNQLNWTTPVASGVSVFELQRTNDLNASFSTILQVPARTTQQDELYTHTDQTPGPGSSYYRLHILHAGGGESYTNVVALGGEKGGVIAAYPNPVDKLLNVRIQGDASHSYIVSLYNVVGQLVFSRQVNGNAGLLQYHRDGTTPKGIYILKVSNMTTGGNNTYKIEFK